jgi:chaperonin GroES
MENIKKLSDIFEEQNVAELLTDEELKRISDEVRQRFETDKKSNAEWLRNADTAMQLCKLERGPKNYPRKNAANIKIPILSTAQLQFSSRASSEIIRNGKLVTFAVQGNDPTGAKARKGARLSKFYNSYILEKISGFSDTIDKLLNQNSMVGTSFIKSYYDYSDGIIKICLVPYDNIFVNQAIRTLEEAEAITEYTYMTSNEIIENIRSGFFREIDLDKISLDPTDPEAIEHQLICAQAYLDLDDDNYKEPYYVIIHDSSSEVLQILPRFSENDITYNEKKEVTKIDGEDYFSDIHFIMSADGSFFGLAYGTMLLDISETVNTAYNQLIDAGHFANTQGGIITKQTRIEKETMEIERGEWIVAEGMDGQTLKDNIFPMDYKEPSTVLFQLAQSLISTSKELTSTTDVVTGQADTTNASPNTVVELINQSLKVNNAIVKRVLRGISKVISKIHRLYSKNVNVLEYLQIVQPSPEEMQEMFDPRTGQLLDFNPGDIDILLIADAEGSTESEKLVQAQQALNIGIQLLPTGAINFKQLALDAFNALQIPSPERYIMPDPDPNAPNPAMIQLQAQLDLNAKQLEMQMRELKMKEQENLIKMEKMKAEIKETLTKAVSNLADAESKEVGTQLEQYTHAMDSIDKVFKAEMDTIKAQKEQAEKANEMENDASQNPSQPVA